MTSRPGRWSAVAAVCCAAGLMQASIAAQDAAPRFTISGTSTVRAWSCPAQGTMKVTPGKSGQPVPGFPTGIQAVSVVVPVKAIACETDAMNDHLREAMKEAQHHDIVFELVQYTLGSNDTATLTGNLTIVGVTKPISLDAKLVSSAQGVHTVGEAKIDMTDFGVAPPVIFEGLLKVGKQIRIKFDAPLQGTRASQ